MPIFSEITFIVIEKPQTEKHVVEITGKDLDNHNTISILAKDKPTGNYYLGSDHSDKDLQIMWTKAGSDETPCFFVEDPRDPSKNLLLEIEHQRTSEL